MDRDKVMSSDMDMGPAEVYMWVWPPWKFVQRIIIPRRYLFKGYDILHGIFVQGYARYLFRGLWYPT
jgi:hypothetical protein